MLIVFFFKQKTAYEMRISDWSSDVCSSDLELAGGGGGMVEEHQRPAVGVVGAEVAEAQVVGVPRRAAGHRDPVRFGEVGGQGREQDATVAADLGGERGRGVFQSREVVVALDDDVVDLVGDGDRAGAGLRDRKSTSLTSSH